MVSIVVSVGFGCFFLTIFRDISIVMGEIMFYS